MDEYVSLIMFPLWIAEWKYFRRMAQNETAVVETGRVRKVVQISTMVHQEKDWAFIALCDDGSLWLYHGSWSRIESVPQTPDP